MAHSMICMPGQAGRVFFNFNEKTSWERPKLAPSVKIKISMQGPLFLKNCNFSAKKLVIVTSSS